MTSVTTTTPPFVEPGGADPVLDELLDRELAYEPTARGEFINHLAMSLVAARRLGATDAELHDWFDGQTADDFLIPRARPGWLDAETAAVERDGIEATLRGRLPGLVRAPFSQFFHAVIRLELAVDAGHAGQVANALRNWDDHRDPVPHPPNGDGSASFATVVDRLLAHPQRQRGWVRDVAAPAGQPWFHEVMADLRADDRLLDEVRSVAIASHVEPTNFGTLHLVTGLRAIGVVARHLDEPDARILSRHTAQAVALAVTTTGPDLLDSPPVPEVERTWAQIGRAALDTGDAHVVKLVYAARIEEATTGDARYRPVAARQAGLA